MVVQSKACPHYSLRALYAHGRPRSSCFEATLYVSSHGAPKPPPSPHGDVGQVEGLMEHGILLRACNLLWAAPCSRPRFSSCLQSSVLARLMAVCGGQAFTEQQICVRPARPRGLRDACPGFYLKGQITGCVRHTLQEGDDEGG